MKLRHKILLVGILIGVAVVVDARRTSIRPQRAAGGPARPEREPRHPFESGASVVDADVIAAAEAVASVAGHAGLSDVDPQPLTQISAEAIDPDATRAAHDDIAMQRDRLPFPGKNLR